MARPDIAAAARAFQPRMWFPHGFDWSEGRLMWVYRPDGNGGFGVGYFCPDGTWVGDGTFDTAEAAAARVHYLNGGIGN